MSIHKLTAGSGYDYLTRQVAALDATHKGHVGLATYYTERGETPGVWVGSGMAGIDGLTAGDVVTAEQMQALFGLGLHPLASERQASLEGPDLTGQDFEAVRRLGAPFKVYENDISPFRVEVATRIGAVNGAAGLPEDWPVPADIRARIRSEVAAELFRVEHGRDPEDARELAAAIAKHSRPRTEAVAGFDLTFSPVKSVSTLWAVADTATSAVVERAHQAAVADALTFLERHALFTRTGTNGVRQVDVRGMVAAAFTHRDSRAGDPDLHTHVAVANKVQTLDGRWLSIDGRVLFKATVAASETYNTALEQHLHTTLGIRFEERPNPDPRKRPIREIVGVDPALNAAWSSRRADIETRRGQLAADFQRDHGRPPTPIEALQLAQRATLETRQAKHEPRTLAEQRRTWHTQASEVLGGPTRVTSMVQQVLHPDRSAATVMDSAWVGRTAQQVLEAMEERRATWQTWHVRAEAQRRIRAADVLADQSEVITNLVVDEVLHTCSVSLSRPADGVDEPAMLRRLDGASVYTVAGADLYTSARVLQAEQRLVTVAGQRDGRVVPASIVDLALLENTANGVVLNPGQADLVHAMATSGVRLQLAIAPAGSGKTTAMQALAAAWTASGGTVIGLAPSAAAAAQLRDQIGAHTDTLAKLTWSLENGREEEWAGRINGSTMVIIDEAGMADTVSLARAVDYVVGRGGSVRLVGDDQQLAAVGAGGVLRDIQTVHGAVRLTELMRFADPAEAAASLALRDGRPEALGFYLDQQRIHAGDLTTMTEEVFTAWQTDRDNGLDTLMLAPTRDLVTQLNQQARTHRLNQEPSTHRGPDAARTTVLADGNEASAGDLVISRTNERRLRITPTDWVKNGDRWTVRTVHRHGDLTVQHHRNGRIIRLPAEYVAGSVELGYATTVHGAQGVTADTMHGLLTGDESRQQLYTMLTRGRTANHLYLQVVGDGDPHSVIRPDTIRPPTATDILEEVLARDATSRSASSLQRDEHDPAVRLGEAAARYVDALYVAAEDVVGPVAVAEMEQAAVRLTPGLSEEPAWPVLRAHLLLLAAGGVDPISRLNVAAAERELTTAIDRAAVLDWRLDDTGLRNAGQGPLPWLPGIPDQLATHPEWGPYLQTRAGLVTDLAERVRTHAHHRELLYWIPPGQSPTQDVLEQVAVWRAATQVAVDDRRPTGRAQLQKAARTWQVRLDHAVTAGVTPAVHEWGPAIRKAARSAADDDFLPVLADRLASLTRQGVAADQLLQSAIAEGRLPDDHGAAALWWRISRHLDPATLAAIERNESADDKQPHDLGVSVRPADQHRIAAPPTPHLEQPTERQSQVEDRWLEADLAVAALVRAAGGGPLELNDSDIKQMMDRADAWRDCPVDQDRMLKINQLTLAYYRSQFPNSWGRQYLTERLGTDLVDDDRFQPGQAPAGWTGLIAHLRRHGVSDQEMTTTGVATVASTGRLIDRFRDRVMFPIIHNEEILGFVGRRHPDRNDTDRAGPKYLNTADTPLFHKGAQLYGPAGTPLAGSIPVIVEGPLDAIAVTLASNGRYTGLAPLGTALTDEQATQIAHHGVNPILATDNDIPGQIAAERAFWHLTPHRLDPLHTTWPAGQDPADVLATHGPAAVTAALDTARPLGDTLLNERFTHLPPDQAAEEAIKVVAARPPAAWKPGTDAIDATLNGDPIRARHDLLGQVKAWTADPRQAAQQPLQNLHTVKTRLSGAAAEQDTAVRWVAVADQLDRRLIHQPDWTALANLMQTAHDQGHNVADAARHLVTTTPLNDLPAQDLRYRLTSRLDLRQHQTAGHGEAEQERRTPRPDRNPISRSTAPRR